MGVRNLPPRPRVGDKLRVHKVPLPSIFPSPGQEGRNEYPITSPLSQAGLRIPPSGSSLPHLKAMHPVISVRWHTMGLFGFDSGSRRYVSMWS